MIFSTEKYIYDIDAVPSRPIVLVPGAGLNASGGPLPLQDRLDAAIELYFDGKVEKILTGDNGTVRTTNPAQCKHIP